MSDLNKRGIIEEHGRHICTLETDDANAFRPYVRSLRNILTISAQNPNTRYYFRSLTLIETERQRHLKISNKLLVVHPFSVFRLYWEAFHLVALLIGFIIIPINFIHGPMQHGDPQYGFSKWCAILELVFDLIYIIDIVMTFFTGYAAFRYKVIHLNYAVIARTYLSNVYFYLDVLSSLTTTALILIYRYKMFQVKVLCWIRLVNAIKISRMWRLTKYLKNVCELLQHYYYSKMVIHHALLFFIGLHWLTCVYIIVSQNANLYATETDMIIHSYEFEMILIFDYMYLYLYIQNIIVMYLLWTSCTNPFTSFYDTTMYTYHHTAVFIAYSAFGFILTSILSILILQLILSMNATEAKYHSIMSQLLNYMQLKKLPESMRERFICYYEYRFQKNYFRESTIMGLLSESIRHDINLHSCRSLIQNVSILRDLPQDILSEVVFHLQHEVYLYNDIIVKAETVGDCMYFIANGSVAVQTPTGREICHLQDGAYFGEIALITSDKKRTAHVVAIEICEVYRLERAHFNNCFQKNTVFFKKIHQTAQERKEKTILLEELHKKYLLHRHNSQSRANSAAYP